MTKWLLKSIACLSIRAFNIKCGSPIGMCIICSIWWVHTERNNSIRTWATWWSNNRCFRSVLMVSSYHNFRWRDQLLQYVVNIKIFSCVVSHNGQRSFNFMVSWWTSVILEYLLIMNWIWIPNLNIKIIKKYKYKCNKKKLTFTMLQMVMFR